MNRDPIGEIGFEFLIAACASGRRGVHYAEIEEGTNIYAFCGNDGVNYFDDLGNDKKSARNRNRPEHGKVGETKGGAKGDRRSKTNGFGGREKPNYMKYQPSKKKKKKPAKCFITLPLMFTFDAFLQEIPEPIMPDGHGNCPPGTCPRWGRFLGRDIFIEFIPCS